MTDENPHGTTNEDEAERDQEMIPLWLAALVLGLLVAVMGVGGYIVAAQVSGESEPEVAEDLEIERWERWVAEYPNDLDAALELAYAYQLAGRYEEAMAEYDRILSVRADDSAALFNKGIVLMQMDRKDEAEDVLLGLLEIDAGHVLAAKALGEHYAETGEYEPLIDTVLPVADQLQSSADLHYLVGFGYENLGETEMAVARYRLALDYYPDMNEAREALSRLEGNE
jgi:tetratricopeptide (TPR) repeat protein